MKRVTVECSIWIAVLRQLVWRAVTEPNQLEQWYAPGCPWEIPNLQVGAVVKFYNTSTDIQVAKIEVVEPLHRFTLRWQPDPMYPAASSVNTFLVEDENGGTRVTVTQTGYESLPEDVRQQQIDQDAEAYMAIVESLKAYLER